MSDTYEQRVERQLAELRAFIVSELGGGDRKGNVHRLLDEIREELRDLTMYMHGTPPANPGLLQKVERVNESHATVSTALAQRIDQLANHVEKLSAQLGRDLSKITLALEGEGDRGGFRLRLDRLEQTEATRVWHFRIVWGALIAAGAKFLFDALR